MSKPCTTCDGKGQWQETQVSKEGDAEMSELVFITCGNCYGTGRSQDPDDGPDYDIGGDSYAADE